MKKLLSLVSILSFIIVFGVTTQAWAPTDFENVNCIDLRELGKTKDLIMLGQDGEKVCGCKKCTVDAVLYNRLGDYIDELKRRFRMILKEPKPERPKATIFMDKIFKFGSTRELKKALEHFVKIKNIENILQGILDYENKEFINVPYRNFLLVSTNCNPDNPATIVQLAKKNNITYNFDYDENYFQNIKEKKILPFLREVSSVCEDSSKKLKDM